MSSKVADTISHISSRTSRASSGSRAPLSVDRLEIAHRRQITLPEFSKNTLESIAKRNQHLELTRQIKTRAQAFFADATTWWSPANRANAMAKLQEILDSNPQNSTQALALLEQLNQLEIEHNKIPLAHTLILQELSQNGSAEARQLLTQKHFGVGTISKNDGAKAAYDTFIRQTAGIPAEPTLFQRATGALTAGAVSVARAAYDAANAVTTTLIDGQLRNAHEKVKKLTEIPLAEKIQAANKAASSKTTAARYKAWYQKNLCADLENKEFAGAIPTFGFKHALKQYEKTLSDKDKARVKQYESETHWLKLKIETKIATGIEKVSNLGIIHAAKQGDFDRLLSPAGLVRTLEKVDNFLAEIQSPQEDPREPAEIKKEIDLNLKHAAEKLALTLIPPGNNPFNWVRRKLMANTLQTYYFQELGKRAWAPDPLKAKPADTFLDPIVPYLQAVSGFDPSSTNESIATKRLLAFSRLLTSLVGSIGVEPDKKQPKSTGHALSIPLTKIIERMNWQKPALANAKTLSWIPSIANIGPAKSLARDELMQEIGQDQILKTLILQGKYKDAIAKADQKHPTQKAKITKAIKKYQKQETHFDEALSKGYNAIIKDRLLPWLHGELTQTPSN